MGERNTGALRGAGSFLTRLLHDTRANAMAIMAAAILPMAGMIGGGIDISRMYILKTRLQHACDAGALAGRKAMGGGTWSYLSYYPRTQAEQFFDGNFESGSFGSSGLTRAFIENAGKVSGSASAVIPMTLMRIFGKTTETITVACDAEMRLPNTDVMFVLDTTGSMADPQPGDTVSKMAALKVAVKCFYEIVARLDTDAICTTGAPSGGTGSQTQIRFGFVPYATNANVGRLLKPEWMADAWPYQTRTLVNSNGSWSSWFPYGRISCAAILANTTTAQYRIASYLSGGRCDIEKRSKVYWKYASASVDISGLKTSTGWPRTFQTRIGDDYTMKSISWDGCIEERETVRDTSYTPIPSGAKDLDIDLEPTGSVNTQWGAVLPGLIYTRQIQADGSGSYNRADVASSAIDYGNTSYYACPVEAKKLQTWPAASDFDDYVDSLSPVGNTYHDIGLIWGARLASPTGIFASENAYTAQGGEIERHIIFMTDGDACTDNDNYTAYGIPYFDRRQTSVSSVPSGGCTSNSYTLTEQVNKRTEALCSAIKNKNITLWVIAFGNLATSTETRLEACATTGRYFKATSAATLQSTFKSIADQISQLRLTR